MKIKRKVTYNNYTLSGPCFLGYLKTLLYGYVLCSLKDEQDAQWFSLSAVLQYYDIFDLSVSPRWVKPKQRRISNLFNPRLNEQ